MEDAVSNFMENTFFQIPLVKKSINFSRRFFHKVDCGSRHEFYIMSLHTCVDDDDALVPLPAMMAFSEFIPLLSDDIECGYEMISCLHIEPYNNYPGFVRLRHARDMIYNWNLWKYEFSKSTKPKFVSGHFIHNKFADAKELYRGRLDMRISGPAMKTTPCVSFTYWDSDRVCCISCPEWPLIAKEWPSRRRNGDWPTEANVRDVVRNGCHIVYSQHRDCREDEYQFRFSFSLAEVILIRSWTPTQQLVFHMLRFFAKRELIQKDCPKEKEFLCTYHLKTLMLWTCEQESAEFWASSSVIAICCKLLRKLLNWIEKRHCPNYFIPEANLFSGRIDPMITTNTADKLKYFCGDFILCAWFAANYILAGLKCDSASGELAQFIEFIEFGINRHYREILRTKRQTQLILLDKRFSVVSFDYVNSFWTFGDVSTIIRHKIKVYARIDKFRAINSIQDILRYEVLFTDLVSGLHMLYTASALSCRRVLNCIDLVSDVLSVVPLRTVASTDWMPYFNFPMTYQDWLPKSCVCLLKAQEYIEKLRKPVNDPEFQLMSRLSMHYLRETLTIKDPSTPAVRSATVVYMASIFFATSQYQVAIDLCTSVLHETKSIATGQPSQRQEVPMNAGCLIFIDDISYCVGFILLFQYVSKTIRSASRRFQLNLRLTPHVLAKYIMIQSTEMMSKVVRINWSEIPTVYVVDFFLITSIKSKLTNATSHTSTMCVYRRNDQVEEVLSRVTGFCLDEDTCIQLLMECALESLDLFYQKIFYYYGVQCCTVVHCYRAMYFFKLCQFDRVRSLCDQILDDLELEDNLHKISRLQKMSVVHPPSCLAFPNILATSPFNAYFDEDLHCLIGLQTLCHVSFPKRAEPNFQRNRFDTVQGGRSMPEHSPPPNETTFCILIEHKTFRYKYFIGRHFMARYLILRCGLQRDKKSASEVCEAFCELSPKLPFEHVVYRFLLRKLNRSFPDWRVKA